MKKQLIPLLVFSLFFLTPLFVHVSAQSIPVSSSLLLQATTSNLSTSGPSVWENMVPINFQENQQNTVPFDIKHLSIVSGPGRMLLLPSSNANTTSTQSQSSDSNLNQSTLLQASSLVPVQETRSSQASQFLSSSAYTFPVNHGEIVIEDASQTLTNKTLSGEKNTFQNIPNAALVNASIKIVGGNGISITGGDVSLGGIVTITNTATNAATSLASDVLAATSGTIDNVSIGNTTPSTGRFTTINGLTITNNGSNTLNIASGKTLSSNNSLTFSGTDGTTLTFPNTSDTIVGLTSAQTLTNKTIAAGANTISGLTVSNFSNSNISQWTNNAGFITTSTVDTLSNKTLTSPTINGTVSTTGLTLPAFTAVGNISGSGSPSITNFGSINGLTITPNATGFSLSGGTTAKALTVNNSMTLAAGADNQTFTFPSTSGTVTVLGNATTGTGSFVLATSPTLTTPNIGAATATTLNGLSITNNGSNTLNIAGGKTLTVNNSLTFSGTDATTFTLPSGSDTLTGLSATQTLTNKTIAAGSNTISGLTNTNLSGSAGITNANLANSTITVNSGTGLSGGASVALGGSVTLTNAGVTSLTGTPNQVNISGSTGGVTLSLPQSINSGASPTFASLALTNTTNQLVLGTTNLGTLTWSPSLARTLTLPDSTDTLIGKTTTDILTNKTLTAPAINGTVTTSGLTLPAFTAAGAITGSGNPTISNFGAINGLTLSSASDGFTLSGGTTSRVLTMTGADLTLGNTIKPTNAGTLTIQSNGANSLSLDSGGSAGISIGATNANAITLGADTTVSASKTLAVTTTDKLTVGGTIIPQSLPIPVSLTATVTTQPVFIADTTYQVTGAKCIPAVLSVSGTFQVTVESGTTAPGSGTSQLSSTISLSGTANTVVSGTLIGSPTTINAGDRVSAKFGGVLTGLSGNCTIYLKRV